MYAIVEVGGHQWKVMENQNIKVSKIDAEVGKVIDLKDVLLYVDDNNIKIGKPVVRNAVVKAEIVTHGKAKKILVFKKKRRKKYRVSKGHRQDYTELTIKSIEVPGITKKAATATKTAASKKKTASEPKKKATSKTTDTKTKTAARKKPSKSQKTAAAKTKPKSATKKTDTAAVNKEKNKTKKSAEKKSSEKKKTAPKKETKSSTAKTKSKSSKKPKSKKSASTKK